MNLKLVKLLKQRPIEIAHLLGFEDMTDLHNRWIREMAFDDDDLTILAHRGSYKTTCISVALSLMIILYPNKGIIFLRKTDDDVIEVVKQVGNILSTPLMQYIVQQLYGIDLEFRQQTAYKIDTNLNTSTKGNVQLLGLGTSGSLTGNHLCAMVCLC